MENLKNCTLNIQFCKGLEDIELIGSMSFFYKLQKK